jgi:hypothetical protein
MGKMYYNEEEAAARLGVGTQDLAKLERDNKLRVFRDGIKKMYKTEEVDALAGQTAEVQFGPGGDAVSLSEAEATPPPKKEDTVITAQGISIFDDEDLEIEQADPMAKTQIAPSMEDQAALEGVGSGSGLLDLTRESDDTSLGAEVLDHIDMETSVSTGPAESAGELGVAPQSMAPGEPMYVMAADATAGLFGGMAAGGAIIALLLAGLAAGVLFDEGSGLMMTLKENVVAVLGGGLGAVIVLAVIGLFLGKASADRQAMRRMSV